LISILIPCFNDDPSNLLEDIIKQNDFNYEDYEVIVYDDASTSTIKWSENNLIKIIHGKSNKGDFASRKILASHAQFQWLLFLDADLRLCSDDFLKIYKNQISQNLSVCYGGIFYQDSPPENNKLLRWTYGKAREEKTTVQPEYLYENFVAASFLIQKDVFLKATDIEPPNIYGTDLLLAAYFRAEQVSISFIYNPAMHTGIEANEIFLEKSLKAVQATYQMEQSQLIPNNHKPLQRLFLKLEKWRLINLGKMFLDKGQSYFIKQINSKNPKLFFLDLLKLQQYIKLKK
jgi:glycosyltransferase involved in cell wall biosynthesis